jgi:hypothetical protein
VCAEVDVSEYEARQLMAAPGNPHLIWDGAEAHVISEDFFRALEEESAWLLIISRKDLASIDPDALSYHPAALARLLAITGDDIAAMLRPCHCTTPSRLSPQPAFPRRVHQ